MNEGNAQTRHNADNGGQKEMKPEKLGGCRRQEEGGKERLENIKNEQGGRKQCALVAYIQNITSSKLSAHGPGRGALTDSFSAVEIPPLPNTVAFSTTLVILCS